MEMIKNHLIFGALLLAISLAGCTGGEAPPPAVQNNEEGKALFEDRCSVCHPLSYPATRGARSLDAWNGVVNEMIGNGAEVTDEEAELVAEYLFQMYGT